MNRRKFFNACAGFVFGLEQALDLLPKLQSSPTPNPEYADAKYEAVLLFNRHDFKGNWVWLNRRDTDEDEIGYFRAIFKNG